MEKFKELSGLEQAPDLTEVPISPPSNGDALLNARETILDHRLAVVGGVLATLATIAASLGPAVPVAPAKDKSPAKFHELEPVKPQKCTPDNRVILAVKGPERVQAGRAASFNFKAKPCYDSPTGGVEAPINVKTLNFNARSTPTMPRIGSVQEANSVVGNHSVILAFGEPKTDKKQSADTLAPQLSITATTSTDQKVGAGDWQLKYAPPSKKDKTSSKTLNGPNTPIRSKPASCNPDPEFEVSVQDKPAFEQQRYGPRGPLLGLANRLLGATTLRMTVSFDEWQRYGPTETVDTAREAKANGYNKVQLTLMPTPKWTDGAKKSLLNYINQNPKRMRKWAQAVAATPGLDVDRYSIGNEPNYPAFSKSQSFKKYKAMYLAGRAGILKAKPNAEILVGEVASTKSSLKWETDSVNKLPGDDYAGHLYGGEINAVPLLVKVAAKKGMKFFGTEYGNSPNAPNQIANNKQAMLIVYCAGGKQISYYDVFDPGNRAPGTWNTAFLPVNVIKQLLNGGSTATWKIGSSSMKSQVMSTGNAIKAPKSN